MKKHRLLFLALLAVAVIAAAVLVSCGKSKESTTNSTTNYSTANQAAGSGSSAKAAVDLSRSMSAAAAGLGSKSNPSGKAPALGGTANAGTEGLSGIDPRLKTLADGMLGQMQASMVTNAVAKARSLRASRVSLASQVTITGVCDGGGTFKVVGSDTSVTGYTEYTVDILMTACTDTSASIHSTLTGTIHAYEKDLTGNASNTRSATIALTAVDYDGATTTKTKVAQGVFTSSDAGTSTSRNGTDSADGSYSETVPVTGGNQVGTFYFTNLTRAWTWDDASGVITNGDTLNGSFGLTITSPGGSLQLDIALAALNDTIRTNTDGSLDQWINGSITITWTPDLTLYGCIGGTMHFVTTDSTPLHYLDSASTCPSSGTLVVNNATIVYGSPITVTVGSDVKTYTDCSGMDSNGMCGN